MIGIDTSVVVPYLVGTPVEQAARATRVIDGDQELGLSILVIVEAAHVLRARYGLSRPDVVEVLLEFVTRENVRTLEIPKADVIDALVRARAFISSPIPDALISASTRAFAAVPVFTFDEKFGRLGAPVATP